MAENESDVVASLLASPFSRRPFNEKLQLIKNGRPTPQLQLNENLKKGERHFKTENYERYPWLTGCQKTNRLYCWSCLLFTTDKSSTWASSGFVSLTNLTKSAHRHQNSASHLQATVSLKTFGDTRVDLQLDEQRRNHMTAHNNKVKQNREILKRLINDVTFLGKQELAFRGHDGSKESENKGNYLE